MILVTGATGMVGGHLLYRLVSEGKKVKALYRSEKKKENVERIFRFYNSKLADFSQNIEWKKCDLLNLPEVENAFHQVDIIYHCAAAVSFNPARKEEIIRNNVQVTANLVDFSLEKNISKFCFISSIAALGSSQKGLPINEKNYWKGKDKNKTSAYSISKFLSEMEVWRGVQEGLDAIILNPSVILGVGDWNSGSPSIFSTIYGGLKFYTKGITGYVDVRDVVNILLQLSDSGIVNERYVVSAENISYQAIFDRIAEKLKVHKPSKKINKTVALLAARMIACWSKVFKNEPKVSVHSVRAGFNKSHYSSDKVIKELAYEFIPINTSIDEISNFFLKDTCNVEE